MATKSLIGIFGVVIEIAVGLMLTWDAVCERRRIGGEWRIRTPDTLSGIPHFECGAFDHSANSPIHQRDCTLPMRIHQAMLARVYAGTKT